MGPPLLDMAQFMQYRLSLVQFFHNFYSVLGRSKRSGHFAFHVWKMQFKLTPLPLVVGVTRQTTFTYLALVVDLNFVREGGWGRNLVKAVFMCEWYCPLAANSIQQHVKRGSVPKPFGQELGSLMGSLGHYVIKILLANKNFTRHFSLTRNHNKKRFTYTFHLQLHYSINSIKI